MHRKDTQEYVLLALNISGRSFKIHVTVITISVKQFAHVLLLDLPRLPLRLLLRLRHSAKKPSDDAVDHASTIRLRTSRLQAEIQSIYNLDLLVTDLQLQRNVSRNAKSI